MYKIIVLCIGAIILITLANLSCSSSEEIKNENKVERDSLKYLVSVPPGMADVKAIVLKFTEENEDLVCQLKIQEVFAYGVSVSPLPPGTEIRLYISKNLLEKESKKIKDGEVIFARISQIRAPRDKEYWEIIMFNKY